MSGNRASGRSTTAETGLSDRPDGGELRTRDRASRTGLSRPRCREILVGMRRILPKAPPKDAPELDRCEYQLRWRLVSMTWALPLAVLDLTGVHRSTPFWYFFVPWEVINFAFVTELTVCIRRLRRAVV
jgi:hypothetical protein